LQPCFSGFFQRSLQQDFIHPAWGIPPSWAIPRTST